MATFSGAGIGQDPTIQNYLVNQHTVKEVLAPNNRITKLGVAIILATSVGILGFCFGLNPLSLTAGLVLGAIICVAATIFQHKPMVQQPEDAPATKPSLPIEPAEESKSTVTLPEVPVEQIVHDDRKSDEFSQAASVDLSTYLNMTNRPIQCPLSKDLIQNTPTDPSVIMTFSEIEKQILNSLRTMEGIIGKSIAELPLYPKIISSGDDLWDLKKPSYMNKIKAPISLGYCTEGWPCIIIKAVADTDMSIARTIYLFTGPQGNSNIKWFGWKDGCSYSRFFPVVGLGAEYGIAEGFEEGFIDIEGNLRKCESVERQAQNLRDLLQGKVAADAQGNKWVLASPE